MNTSITISQSDVARILAIHAIPGTKVPLFFGLPGLGKTAMVNQFAASVDADVYTFMAPHYTPQDIKGFGLPDREAGFMTFMPTDELPWRRPGGPATYAEANGGRRCVVLVDELCNSSIQVFNLCLQLILEKRIGHNELYPDVIMAAASNSAAMRTGSNKLTMSLADRFAIYNVEPNMNDVVDYFQKSEKINPWVLAYQSSYAASGGRGMWTIQPKDWNGEEPIDSARSYEKLSAAMSHWRGDDHAMMNDDLFRPLCAAHIGQAAGTRFAEFVRQSIEVGPVEELLEKAETCRLPDKPDLRWGIAVRIIPLATRKEETFNQAITLARRLTSESMRPTDPAQPSVFEVFLVKAAIVHNPKIAMWKSVNQQLQRCSAAAQKA